MKALLLKARMEFTQFGHILTDTATRLMAHGFIVHRLEDRFALQNTTEPEIVST